MDAAESIAIETSGFGKLQVTNIWVDRSGRRHGLTQIDGGQTFQILLLDDSVGVPHNETVVKLLDSVSVPPLETGVHDDLRYRIYSNFSGQTLRKKLLEVAEGNDPTGGLELVKMVAVPLCTLFARLHDRDLFFGDASPDWFVLNDDGTVALNSTATPHGTHETLPLGETPIRVNKGFTAPEVYGRCMGTLGPASDVYFLGTIIYSLLAGIMPFGGTAHGVIRLPPLRAYQDAIPPMVGAVAMRACSPYPIRRYRDAMAMRRALDTACESDRERDAFGIRTLEIDEGNEIHIGLVKALYSPVNQDQLFVGFDQLSSTGLFMVSDGVSISRYGSGDLASGCVRQAAAILWNQVACQASALSPDDTLTLDTGGTMDVQSRFPDTPEGRRAALDGMLNHANVRIGQMVEPMLPSRPQPIESIMAATAVAMMLDRNQATIGYIGDSRVYLIRDGHIAQLTVDHNLKTQLVRNGRAPAVARQAQGANALVRCVGDFERAPDYSLVALPLSTEFMDLTILPGDSLVLCSDGVVDYADFDEEGSEEMIRQIVEDAPTASNAAFELMVAANRGGGGDNISCIVLQFTALVQSAGVLG